MNPNIYILSQPIHTGKTTLLINWLQKQKGACGILTPDVEGVRMLYDVAQKIYHPLQIDEAHPAHDAVQIGKFRFSKTGFHVAKEILLRSAGKCDGWLIVDEVGALEMKQQAGLEPVLSHIIALYKDSIAKGKLLLVIRDYLLEEAVAHYHIEGATVLYKSFFE